MISGRDVDGPLVVIRALSKSFDGVEVLHAVTFSIAPGEAHGLVGENGSGKSTVIKILAGYHEPDAGSEVRIDGESLAFPLPPGRSGSLGLAFVHQDLALIPSLSVAENLFATELGEAGSGWRYSTRTQERRAGAVLRSFNVDLDPSARVASLSQVERALLAIIRAVSAIRARAGEHQRGLLVLDEPTVFLPRADRERLYGLMREVTSRGSSVLFVSHDLDECLAITDRTSVLRDGFYQGTVVPAEVTKDRLVEMIIGRRLDQTVASKTTPDRAAPLARVRGLKTRTVRGADLDIRAGEIVGVTGVIGSGFDEIPYALFGASRGTEGSLEIDGRTRGLADLQPAGAVDAGLALVPGDRLRDGAAGSLSVGDNITLQILRAYRRAGLLRRRAAERDAAATARRFDVRPPDPRRRLKSLSGGNQQKVVLAKWLQTDPRLLLLHEPTQGVDVGARQQIYDVIHRAASRGAGVLCASADHEQLATLCDRVLVFVEGSVSIELTGALLSKHEIAKQAYGMAPVLS